MCYGKKSFSEHSEFPYLGHGQAFVTVGFIHLIMKAAKLDQLFNFHMKIPFECKKLYPLAGLEKIPFLPAS